MNITATFVGNLGKNAEVITLGQTQYFKMNVGVSYEKAVKNPNTGQYENVKDSMWVNVRYRYSENLAQYLTKGTKVLINGSLIVSQSTGNDGRSYVNIDCRAYNLDLITVKEAQQATAPQQGYAMQPQQGYVPTQPQQGFMPQAMPQAQPQQGFMPQAMPTQQAMPMQMQGYAVPTAVQNAVPNAVPNAPQSDDNMPF